MKTFFKWFFLQIAFIVTIIYASARFFLFELWVEYYVCLKYSLLGCYYGYVWTSTTGTFHGMNEFVLEEIKKYDERKGVTNDKS